MLKKSYSTKILTWFRKLIKKYANCSNSNNFDFSTRLRLRLRLRDIRGFSFSLRLLIYPCCTIVYKDNIYKYPAPPPAGME